MIVISKDGKSIINTAHIVVIYIGADGFTIKADYANGKGCQIGRYRTQEATETAMNYLADNIRYEVCQMPSDEYVSAMIARNEHEQHHVKGKKTKGHGGS